jgi:hypothetical protein
MFAQASTMARWWSAGTATPLRDGSLPGVESGELPPTGAAAWQGLPMIRLSRALNAWGTPEFNGVLVQEIEQLTIDQLPLQQGLSTGSHALDNRVKAMILSVVDEGGYIRARAGIFYTGIIAGCSCADDPTPVNEENEYCEVQLDIDKATAGTTVVLLAE